MSSEYILVKGARQNNLKGLNLRLPLNELIVITGVSVTFTLTSPVLLKQHLGGLRQGPGRKLDHGFLPERGSDGHPRSGRPDLRVLR